MIWQTDVSKIKVINKPHPYVYTKFMLKISLVYSIGILICINMFIIEIVILRLKIHVTNVAL